MSVQHQFGAAPQACALLDVGGKAANIQQKEPGGGCVAPTPPPGGDEAQLWLIDLAAAAGGLGALWQTLSPDERARAERLRIPLARTRFVAARGMLRAALARYAGVAPEALRFRYGPAGKPRIDGPLGELVSFNLSHSHNLALLAVARAGPVGVDIELIADADDAVIAGGFFAPAERRALAELPPALRRAAFYRCWVCKEAFVKAVGGGQALDRFAVSVDPAAPAALLHIDGDPDAARAWRLIAITPAEGFVAALAVERRADDPLHRGEAAPHGL